MTTITTITDSIVDTLGRYEAALDNPAGARYLGLFPTLAEALEAERLELSIPVAYLPPEVREVVDGAPAGSAYWEYMIEQHEVEFIEPLAEEPLLPRREWEGVAMHRDLCAKDAEVRGQRAADDRLKANWAAAAAAVTARVELEAATAAAALACAVAQNWKVLQRREHKSNEDADEKEAANWAASIPTAKQAWEECRSADWLFNLVARLYRYIPREALTRTACAVARLALPSLAPNTTWRGDAEHALLTAEAFVKGGVGAPTKKQMDNALQLVHYAARQEGLYRQHDGNVSAILRAEAAAQCAYSSGYLGNMVPGFPLAAKEAKERLYLDAIRGAVSWEIIEQGIARWVAPAPTAKDWAERW